MERVWWARVRAALGGVTTAELTDRLAAGRGEATAVVGREVWSYGAVHRFVAAASEGLRRAGVRPGDRVAVCTANGLEMPLLMLAVLRAGAVVVPLNHQLRSEELRFILQDCGAATLIADAGIAGEVAALRRSEAPRALRQVLWVPGGEVAPPEGLGRTLDVRLGDATWSVPASVSPSTTAAIFYTSGTTGFPKGARLSSGALLSRFGWLALLPLWPRYSVLYALPTAHIMGFAAFLGFLMGAAEIHYMARFDASEVLDRLEAEGIDGFLGVPSMYQLLAAAGAGERELRSVRVFGSAADVMPGALIDQFKELGRSFGRGGLPVPASFVELYGSVELSGAAMARVSLPGVAAAAGGFVGVPLPGFRARIVDEAGREQPVGVEGELLLQGPGVFQGYHGQEAATGAALETDRRGPWLRTGDLALKTRLGLIQFVGRERDVIKSGGYSIFPAELETKLLEHPAVEAAAVVGLPHPTKGALPVAFVCLRAGDGTTPEALHAWISERVARYKAPRRVVVLRREEMPYGATGKITKRSLQARFGDLLIAG